MLFAVCCTLHVCNYGHFDNEPAFMCNAVCLLMGVQFVELGDGQILG